MKLHPLLHFPLKASHQTTMYAYTRQNPAPINLVHKNGILSQEHQITHRDCYSEVQFTPIHHRSPTGTDDSAAASPRLWPRSTSRPLLGADYRSLSPDSRAQAIARGRSELMEMVRNMPESSYELSLRDIVEHHHREENQSPQNFGAAELKKEEDKRFDKDPSFEDKGLLNMVFPCAFRSKKKKKIGSGNSGRVSPKPEGLKVGGEWDWRKKKFTGSSDSDSSKSGATTTTSTVSSNSGGGCSRSDSRGRRKHGFTCWHLFHSRRSKSA